MSRRLASLALLALLVGVGAVPATSPPALLNYQGVLRSAVGQPLDGTYDMVFRFLDPGAQEILVDKHTASQGGSVTVTGGLFNVKLGGGLVQDGSGSGVYISPSDVFRDYAEVYLEIQVNGEALSPTVRVLASAYALNASNAVNASEAVNASNLAWKPASAFLDTSATSQAKEGELIVGATSGNSGVYGIEGYGPDGGAYFKDTDNSGYATIATNNYGVFAAGYNYGGYFYDFATLASASLGFNGGGVSGYGSYSGGYFADTTNSGQAWVGFTDYGIWGQGSVAGAYFKDTNSSGAAYVGYGDRGVSAYGYEAGGYFKDEDSSGLAFVGYGDRGIWGKGTFAGATFSHPDNVTHWTDVSQIVSGTTYKIRGTGTVSFVQNHPYRKDQVVVFAAPEGDEVAVYTRGTARLTGGEARVRLAGSFALVANPDVGLTAHLTPRGEQPVPMSVADLSPEELVVRGPAGSDAAFDYFVYGLRIGFERHASIQPKDREAFLPEARGYDAFYAAHPDLLGSSALSRFDAMRGEIGESTPLDLSRARTLASAIDEGRDAIIASAREEMEGERQTLRPAPPEQRAGLTGNANTEAKAPPVTAMRPSSSPPPEAATAPTVEETAGTTPADTRTWMDVSEAVELGDLLALDPERPGVLRRAAGTADPNVVGIALAGSKTIEGVLSAPVLGSGFAEARVDAGYGEIHPGDLLTSSPTPGHAMRAHEALPGTSIGKALDAMPTGTGTIRVLVMPR